MVVRKEKKRTRRSKGERGVEREREEEEVKKEKKGRTIQNRKKLCWLFFFAQTPSARFADDSILRSCFGGSARLRVAALRGELCRGKRERGFIFFVTVFFSFSDAIAQDAAFFL